MVTFFRSILLSTASCNKCNKLLKNIPSLFVYLLLFYYSKMTVGNDSGNSYDSNTQQYEDSHFECFDRKGLHCIHINARSLLPKMSELRIIAHRTRAAVIAVSETWLDESVTDQEVKIDGYVVTRNDRARSGGGVCIYTRTNVAFNPRKDIECENMEAEWLEILLPKSKPFLIGAVYRPPKCNNFLQLLEETVTRLDPGQEVIVLGDINICWVKDITSLGCSYRQLLNVSALSQLIKDPTRVTDKSSTCLDHIIVSNKEKICQSGVIPIGISDHYLRGNLKKEQKVTRVKK